MKKINTWDYWQKNWENASAFFISKGNVKTRSKLKDKGYRDFMKIFDDIEENLKPLLNDSSNKHYNQFRSEQRDKMAI